MMIYQWLPSFIDSIRSDGWPDAGRVMDVWFPAFMSLEPKPRKDETEAAAGRIRWRGTSGPGDYLAALIPEILAARERAREPAAAPASERETAARESRSCPHCSGSGLATIYHPRYDGTPEIEVEGPDGGLVRIVSRMAAHCSCPLGRWMRSRTEPEMLRRIPCLVKTLARTRWTLDDPMVLESVR